MEFTQPDAWVNQLWTFPLHLLHSFISSYRLTHDELIRIEGYETVQPI